MALQVLITVQKSESSNWNRWFTFNNNGNALAFHPINTSGATANQFNAKQKYYYSAGNNEVQDENFWLKLPTKYVKCIKFEHFWSLASPIAELILFYISIQQAIILVNVGQNIKQFLL